MFSAHCVTLFKPPLLSFIKNFKCVQLWRQLVSIFQLFSPPWFLPIYQQAESNKLRCSNHLTFQTTTSNIRSQGPQSGSTAGFPHWLWLGGVTPRGRWWSMGPKTANKQLPLLNCRRQIPSEPEANLPATLNSSNKDFDVDSRVDQQKKRHSSCFPGWDMTVNVGLSHAKPIRSSCDDRKQFMHLPRRHMVFLYSATFQPDHILGKSQYAKNCLAIFTLERERSRPKKKTQPKSGTWK